MLRGRVAAGQTSCFYPHTHSTPVPGACLSILCGTHIACCRLTADLSTMGITRGLQCTRHLHLCCNPTTSAGPCRQAWKCTKPVSTSAQADGYDT
eukprot:1143635-Pelagomonas_calceolata.AAC.9